MGVNGVMILFYRQLAATFLSGQTLLGGLQLRDGWFSLSSVYSVYAANGFLNFGGPKITLQKIKGFQLW